MNGHVSPTIRAEGRVGTRDNAWSWGTAAARRQPCVVKAEQCRQPLSLSLARLNARRRRRGRSPGTTGAPRHVTPGLSRIPPPNAGPAGVRGWAAP